MIDDIHNKVKSLLVDKRHPLTDDESLVISGLLSSLKIVEIASWLEKNYGVDFSENFNVYDFDTVNSIYALTLKKN